MPRVRSRVCGSDPFGTTVCRRQGLGYPLACPALMGTPRNDGRRFDALRPIEIRTDFTKWAEGSVYIACGDTHVLCNASVEERVPPWLKDQGGGWVTAEYAMLPRATDRRTQRESLRGKVGGRTHEISRLIGRSLRGAVDLQKLGPRTVTVDCDVLQAAGGTRTASITGGWVALALAMKRLTARGILRSYPITGEVAAVSLGVVDGEVLLDLALDEDQQADTDLNLVTNGEGAIIEIQGTAEGKALDRGQLLTMLELGDQGMSVLRTKQREALEAAH